MGMDKKPAKNPKKLLGPNIREARSRLNISQARLAEMLEMSTEVLGRMERKEVLPRLERFVLLCEILGTTPNQMLGFTPGLSNPQGPRMSPAYDEMMTLMRHFVIEMESQLAEDERKELMQIFAHLQRLITLIKKRKAEAAKSRRALAKRGGPAG